MDNHMSNGKERKHSDVEKQMKPKKETELDRTEAESNVGQQSKLTMAEKEQESNLNVDEEISHLLEQLVPYTVEENPTVELHNTDHAASQLHTELLPPESDTTFLESTVMSMRREADELQEQVNYYKRCAQSLRDKRKYMETCSRKMASEVKDFHSLIVKHHDVDSRKVDVLKPFVQEVQHQIEELEVECQERDQEKARGVQKISSLHRELEKVSAEHVETMKEIQLRKEAIDFLKTEAEHLKYDIWDIRRNAELKKIYLLNELGEVTSLFSAALDAKYQLEAKLALQNENVKNEMSYQEERMEALCQEKQVDMSYILKLQEEVSRTASLVIHRVLEHQASFATSESTEKVKELKKMIDEEKLIHEKNLQIEEEKLSECQQLAAEKTEEIEVTMSQLVLTQSEIIGLEQNRMKFAQEMCELLCENSRNLQHLFMKLSEMLGLKAENADLIVNQGACTSSSLQNLTDERVLVHEVDAHEKEEESVISPKTSIQHEMNKMKPGKMDYEANRICEDTTETTKIERREIVTKSTKTGTRMKNVTEIAKTGPRENVTGSPKTGTSKKNITEIAKKTETEENVSGSSKTGISKKNVTEIAQKNEIEENVSGSLKTETSMKNKTEIEKDGTSGSKTETAKFEVEGCAESKNDEYEQSTLNIFELPKKKRLRKKKKREAMQ